MSAELTIVAVSPEIFNPNGDAENARVLARRCEWAGLSARVLRVAGAADVPERVDAVVIGSAPESQLAHARAILASCEQMLRTAVEEGAPVLAVGTGLELLGESLELSDGTRMPGLGLAKIRATARPERVVGEVVVDGPFGRLVGYENHGRDLVVDGETLGAVVAGSGNGSGGEGIVAGSLYGTHLHGPVLAKNPALADRLLEAMATRAGMSYRPGERAVLADGYASQARQAIIEGLGLAK